MKTDHEQFHTILLLNATTELSQDTGTLQKPEETLEVSVCYHSPAKGWFVSNGSMTKYQQSYGREGRSRDRASHHNLGFREYPTQHIITVTPLTQTSSLEQTPPRPLSPRKTEKSAIRQNAWEVKDGSTVFVFLSCWEQEHRIIKVTLWNLPAKLLTVTSLFHLLHVTETHGGDGETVVHEQDTLSLHVPFK